MSKSNISYNEHIELKNQKPPFNPANEILGKNLNDKNANLEYRNVINDINNSDEDIKPEIKEKVEIVLNDQENKTNVKEKPLKKSKNKRIPIFTLIDSLIDDAGITWYHIRIYTILSLFFMADGAEMIVISLLIKRLGEIWNLSHTEKGFTGSVVFVGFFIGALVAGKISDTHGRKPVFVTGAILVCIFSTASAFANNFTTFLILRALNGFGVGISIPSSSSLAAEITPTQYRSWVLNLVWIFFPIGEVFVTIIAKYVLSYEDGWRYLLGFAAAPTLISAIISFFIFESPRFYFTIRNYDKAFIGLERMIKDRKNDVLDHSGGLNNNNLIDYNNNTNNAKKKEIVDNRDIEVNPNQVSSGDDQSVSSQNINPYKNKLKSYLTFNNKINEEGKKIIKIENERVDEIKTEFKTLLKKEFLLLTIICCMIFFVCSFVYYGLIYILPQTIVYVDPSKNNLTIDNLNFTNLNNTYSNSSNFTLNSIEEKENEDEMYRGVILSALSEIPATFLTGYIGNLPFLGRKGSMLYGFILSGISGILCSMYMRHLSIFATALKFSINIPFGMIYLYVSEAFPTKIRTISIGVTNSFNRIGGMTTPIVSQMAFASQPNNPYKIYGMLSFFTAILCYMLPFETLGRNIY